MTQIVRVQVQLVLKELLLPHLLTVVSWHLQACSTWLGDDLAQRHRPVALPMSNSAGAFNSICLTLRTSCWSGVLDSTYLQVPLTVSTTTYRGH